MPSILKAAKPAIAVAAQLALSSVRARERSSRTGMQEVLDVAADLFGRKGFRGTSLADVGAALGMSQASLYTYAQSKADLLKRIILRTAKQLRDTAFTPEFDRIPVPRALEQLVRDHCRSILDYPNDIRSQVRERREIDRAVLASIADRERILVAAVKRVIERGIRTRSLRAMDPSVATQLTLDTANSLLRWYRPSGALPAEQVVDEVWRYVAGALGVRVRASPKRIPKRATRSDTGKRTGRPAEGKKNLRKAA